MKQVAESRIDNNIVEKRSHTRRDIDHYPVLVKKTDNTRIHAYLTNISRSGLQVKCNRLSAHILAPKSGLIEDKNKIVVELSSILPFKNKLEKILLNCAVKYMAVTKDSNGEHAFAVGMHILECKGNSNQVIERILNGEQLPRVKSNIKSVTKPGVI